MAAAIDITLMLPSPLMDVVVTVPSTATVGYVRDKARELLLPSGCLDQGGIVHLLRATGEVANGMPVKEKIITNEILVVGLGTLNIYVEVEPFEVNPNQAGAFFAHSQ